MPVKQPLLPPATVLGIETSCDETAAAVVRLADGRVEVLADVVWTQIEEHAPYGGVVPEIAARSHVEKLDAVIASAMAQAGLGFADLDGVAATAGPGLIGGVMVGLMTGKAIALARGLPLIAINHLEGHVLSPRLAADLPFPYLLLLASGGHCQFLAVEGLGRYRRLGSTVDDAAGEAFDKAAKVLGLGFPGGPAVERAARTGDPARFPLPRAFLGRPGCDLSFAGLKTAVLRTAQAMPAMTDQDRADLAASFQAAVVDVIADRAWNALTMAGPGTERLVVAGGVAANGPLRARLEALAAERDVEFFAPPLRYCTDNAAMIALAGAERLAAGLIDGLDAPARARWPLDAAAAAERPVHTPGRKGAKA
ncbi:MAG: tRNA (adenosine(37)-N6)-threonylcarbamoyltransferase complex transferase subunit TsaD [Hyphomonadaceae bacterium]|nr:MAG: O-sialoglycoprotein endopeptidase [Caulobacteraceae bacterium]MBT9444099.1 tRNA (adenosine(37)-N6)-threonylcarbamoyltransferase complex transferase subunit TsaD [Hyphomonadaceae bacterium]TPW05524.1 MAG: O-sialoglycoprotein endopeptidase [Alphaproteobacteria bacterium]